MVIDPSNVVSLHRIFNHHDMMGLRMHIKPTTLTLHIAAENSGIFRTRSVCACSGHGNFWSPILHGHSYSVHTVVLSIVVVNMQVIL